MPRKLLDALTHDFASLEFYRGPRRNYKTAAGLIGVPTDARLRQSRLKHAEIAQFNWNVIRQAVGDLVQCALDDVEDMMLHHPGLVADRNDDVALR